MAGNTTGGATSSAPARAAANKSKQENNKTARRLIYNLRMPNVFGSERRPSLPKTCSSCWDGISPFERDILEHTMKTRRLLLIVALAMPCSLAAASGPVSPAALPEIAEDGIVKSVSVGSDLRISGVQSSVCLTSDVRVNFWDPLKIVAATNNYAGTSENQFYSTDGGKTWGQSALPLLPGDVFHLNPAVDWTSDATAWSVVVGVKFSPTEYRLRAYKSTDHGATWLFDGTPSG